MCWDDSPFDGTMQSDYDGSKIINFTLGQWFSTCGSRCLWWGEIRVEMEVRVGVGPNDPFIGFT